jgi:hypothetical protein
VEAVGPPRVFRGQNVKIVDLSSCVRGAREERLTVRWIAGPPITSTESKTPLITSLPVGQSRRPSTAIPSHPKSNSNRSSSSSSRRR